MSDSDDQAATNVRLAAHVHGMVQGVGFRYWTARKAEELGLTGSVTNDAGGSVTVVAEGPQPVIIEFRRWLSSSAAPGRVTQVDESMSPAQGTFTSFRIVS